MTEKTETKQSGDTASKDGDRGIKVIGILCNWCSYAGADSAGTARLKQPVDLRIVRTPCTGRIDPIFALKAFEKGAERSSSLQHSDSHQGGIHLPAPRRRPSQTPCGQRSDLCAPCRSSDDTKVHWLF